MWAWAEANGRKQLLTAITAIGLASPAIFILRNHPNQNVYFNELLWGDQLGRYDLDYWGLSYRQGFEELLRIDQREKIKVAINAYPGELNWEFLRPHEKPRFELLDKSQADQADYFISAFRHWESGFRNYQQKAGPYAGEEVYSVKLGATKILVVYRISGK